MKKYLKEYWPYLLALLPVMLLRDFSPASELRYVSLATELINGNHLFCLTWQGEEFPYITPLYVWLIALLKLVFGHHFMITITLLFSFIPSIIILAIMNRWVEKYDAQSFRLKDGSQSRMLASIMLFTCGMQLAMSFFVSPDMLFSLWIVAALYTFWRLIMDQGSYGLSKDIKKRKHLQWRFGLYVFLAVFTKGPLGFIIPLVSTTLFLLFSGRIRRWASAWNWRGWIVFLGLMSIWLYLTYLEGGAEWLDKMMLESPLAMFLHPEHHNRPWYYYLLSLWADTLPWGPICIVVIVISLIRRIHHNEFHWNRFFGTPLQNFFAITIAVSLVYFSAQKMKLDVNMLPAYPFLVYLGVMQLEQWRWPVRLNWPMIWVCRIVLLIVFIGGLLCPWLNLKTCYGRICYHANGLQRELNTEKFYVYKVRRPKGMDVYLHEDPIEATPEDIAEGKLKNTLLIMKEYRLDRLKKNLDELGVPAEKQGEVIDELGDYIIVRFR